LLVGPWAALDFLEKHTEEITSLLK
jgi:hypothetical protein